jgi:hypothetical protein
VDFLHCVSAHHGKPYQGHEITGSGKGVHRLNKRDMQHSEVIQMPNKRTNRPNGFHLKYIAAKR